MGINSVESIKRGLSKREALALTRLASQGKSIITVDDIEEAVEVPREEARKIASDLVEKKWLNRLKRGTYLIVPLAAGETGEYTEHEFIIASHLTSPMYISYWSALNYHGLTEQVPVTVYGATTKQTPTQEIHGVTYKFVKISESKFFGYGDRLIDQSHSVSIADMEKAIADSADHPEHCGGITELGKALENFARNESLTETLSDYLLKLGNGAATKRIVYLADVFNLELPRREELEKSFTSGYSKLDPTRAKEGRYNSQYKLQINVDNLAP